MLNVLVSSSLSAVLPFSDLKLRLLPH